MKSLVITLTYRDKVSKEKMLLDYQEFIEKFLDYHINERFNAPVLNALFNENNGYYVIMIRFDYIGCASPSISNYVIGNMWSHGLYKVKYLPETGRT